MPKTGDIDGHDDGFDGNDDDDTSGLNHEEKQIRWFLKGKVSYCHLHRCFHNHLHFLQHQLHQYFLSDGRLLEREGKGRYDLGKNDLRPCGNKIVS